MATKQPKLRPWPNGALIATRTLIRGNGLKAAQLAVEPPPVGSLVWVHGWGRIKVLPPRPNVSYGIVTRHAAISGNPSCVVENETGSAIVPAAMLLPRAPMIGTMTLAWGAEDGILLFSGRSVKTETAIAVVHSAVRVRSHCATLVNVTTDVRPAAKRRTRPKHNDVVATPEGLATVIGGESYAMTSDLFRVHVRHDMPVVFRPEGVTDLSVHGYRAVYLPDGSVRIGCQHVTRCQLMDLTAEVVRHYKDAVRIAAVAEAAFMQVRESINTKTSTPTRGTIGRKRK